eukprot:scaffold181874_cov40-Tisochrysis_lutea.AAC.1
MEPRVDLRCTLKPRDRADERTVACTPFGKRSVASVATSALDPGVSSTAVAFSTLKGSPRRYLAMLTV